MKYAIVQSGGKQFRASEGDVVDVERLSASVGDTIELDQVLLLGDGQQVTVGAPTVAGVRLQATVLEQIRAPKVIVFKYKPKQRYRVKSGHRHAYTRVRIDRIVEAA